MQSIQQSKVRPPSNSRLNAPLADFFVKKTHGFFCETFDNIGVHFFSAANMAKRKKEEQTRRISKRSQITNNFTYGYDNPDGYSAIEPRYGHIVDNAHDCDRFSKVFLGFSPRIRTTDFLKAICHQLSHKIKRVNEDIEKDSEHEPVQMAITNAFKDKAIFCASLQKNLRLSRRKRLSRHWRSTIQDPEKSNSANFQ